MKVPIHVLYFSYLPLQTQAPYPEVQHNQCIFSAFFFLFGTPIFHKQYFLTSSILETNEQNLLPPF